MDLPLILNEFEAYYEMKFDRKPKMVRKISPDEERTRPRAPSDSTGSKKPPVSRTKSEGGKMGSNSSSSSNNSNSEKFPSVQGASPPSSSGEGMDGLSLKGSSVSSKSTTNDQSDDVEKVENRLLRPPPQFGLDSEMKQLAGAISREIYQDSPNVR